MDQSLVDLKSNKLNTKFAVCDNQKVQFRTSRFWQRVHAKSIGAERIWSVYALVRSAILTAISWSPVASPVALATLIVVGASKSYLSILYAQTCRNILLYHQPFGPLGNFLIYYCKRLSVNLLNGLVTLAICYGSSAFSFAMLCHLFCSCFSNSSHFVVGKVEACLVKKGVLGRRFVANLIGVMSVFGTLTSQMDLAGLEILSIRPFWFNLAANVSVLLFYLQLCMSRSLRRTKDATGTKLC